MKQKLTTELRNRGLLQDSINKTGRMKPLDFMS
jgi:hypothetical protein